jgi:hypothetical protein
VCQTVAEIARRHGDTGSAFEAGCLGERSRRGGLGGVGTGQCQDRVGTGGVEIASDLEGPRTR